MLNLKIKVCLILAVASIQSANSVTFECKFETATWPNIKNVYSCNVQRVIVDDNNDFLSVSGSHAKGKDNGDVRFLNIGLGIDRIPTNIGNTFKKLKGVQFWFAGLQSISPDDLKQFSGLEIFSVHGNVLETLDGDLLNHNSKLKWVDFRNNSISHIGPDFLKNMKDLKEIFFSGNICIDMDAQSSKSIKELKKLLPLLCPVVEQSTSTLSTTREESPTSAETSTSTQLSTSTQSQTTNDSCPEACSLLIDESLQNF